MVKWVWHGLILCIIIISHPPASREPNLQGWQGRLSAHQVELVLVFCVVLQHVNVAVETKEVVHILHGLVVWHVAYKQLYLCGLRLWGLPATARGREGGPVAGHLVDGADALGLRQARREGGGGGGGGVFTGLCGG